MHSPSTDELARFTALVERYKPLIYRWALGLVADSDDAEDVTQEVFVLIYRRLSSFRGEGTLDGWIYRVVRRVAYRRLRKSHRRTALATLPSARSTAEVYLTDPGGRVDRERLVEIVQLAAAELPERQRELFDLCDLQGYSPTEAAELVGLKPVSVRASLFKARRSVRRELLRLHPHYSEADNDVR